MVRVASLKDQVHAGYEKPDIAGLTPEEQLAQKSAQETHELVRVQYNTFSRSVLPAAGKGGAAPGHGITEKSVRMTRQSLWTGTLRITLPILC